MEKISVQFGQSEILFSLEYSERKTLGIFVHPDLSVRVNAPIYENLTRIKEKVKAKAPWIVKQQGYFRSLRPFTPERKYISGESHLYLGRQYKLKLVTDSSDTVKLSGGILFAHITDMDRDHVKSVLSKWYKSKAEDHFNVLYKERFEKFKTATKYKGGMPNLSIKTLEKRWGSCTPTGRIILNSDLIRASKLAIEYVIVHELCHLIYHDHSKKFYGLLYSVMPDWELRKDRLEKSLV